MSLQDKHLQQALKNAPDRDMVPNDATREAVLTYANSAVKRRYEAWLKRISNLLREWLGSSWHMAGIGSAVATVLIVVVFWHEVPDDAMRKVAAPSEETEFSTADSAMERVPEAASADNSLSRASSGAVAPAQESSTTIIENKAAIDEMPSKAKSASPVAAENREALSSTSQPVLKNSGLAEATPQAAAPAVIEPETTAVTAPAPVAQDKSVVAAAPTVAASPAEVSSTAIKSELSKELQAESDANLRMRKENIVAKKPATKADMLGASAPKAVTLAQENQTFLARIKYEGGKVLANQDIQAGNLRLLKVEMQSKDLDTLNCPQLTAQAIVVDTLTGYKIESIGSCDATDSLLKEVEVYNQAMRDWHRNHPR